MERVSNLENVKIGDKFLINSPIGFGRESYARLVLCESVTPKQCVIGGRRYRKSDVRAIGDYYCAYGSAYLYKYSAEAISEGKKRLFIHKVKHYDLHKLTDEQCLEIWNIIQGA